MDGNTEALKIERKKWPMFEPIDEATIEKLRVRISERLGVDLSILPITIDRPGDWRFDFQEAQTKLYLKSGSLEDYKALLARYGLNFEDLPRNADQLLRQIAEDEGVILDDTFQGFVYNLGGRHIMYVPIREDKVLEMAERYKNKEKDSIELKSIEDAKRYLQSLAEKYFYHEIGHTVFKFLLDDNTQLQWANYVSSNQSLADRVVEVQLDKHPSPEAIPVVDEAFADLFVEVAGNKKSRLGNYEEAVELIKNLLRENGFNLTTPHEL